MNRRETVQRDMVYRVAMQLFHPTADEVCAGVRALCPTIGRATVFRNLRVLSQEKRLEPVFFPGEPTRYDTNVAHHHHFVCRDCGKIIDLPTGEQLPKPTLPGAVIDGQTVTFLGYCGCCHDRQVRPACV